MRKSYLLTGVAGIIFSTHAFGAGNTGTENVTYIESRSSGIHAISITQTSLPPYNDTAGVLINEACSLSDRAILNETDPAGKTEFAILLSAMLLNKKVILRVDGCTPIDTSTPSTTAPKIVKVKINS